jgi:hypothetical protein
MELVFASTMVLEKTQKRLGGFDAAAFRSDFGSELQQLGCDGVRAAQPNR